MFAKSKKIAWGRAVIFYHNHNTTIQQLNPTMTTDYKCMCGAFEASLKGPPVLAVWCHCSQCRYVLMTSMDRFSDVLLFHQKAYFTSETMCCDLQQKQSIDSFTFFSISDVESRRVLLCNWACGPLTISKWPKATILSSSTRVVKRSFAIRARPAAAFATRCFPTEPWSPPWELSRPR